MWFFNLVPDFLFHISVVIGIIVFIASTIMPFLPKRTTIQVISVILLSMGFWGEGVITSEHTWNDKVIVLEKRLAEKETQGAKTNIVIQTEYVDRIKTVTEVKWKVKKEIIEKEKIINANCTVPPEAINILNEAAK